MKMKEDLRTSYIIAEMACSHEGKVELAKQIIDGAGQARADAIQFQIWKLAEIMVPAHPDYKDVSAIELSEKEWKALAEYVRKEYPNMDIIACVYEHTSVDFCESINVEAYKIHSADLSNPDLVKYVANTGKRIDLSVGASTLDEIQNALNWIRSKSDSQIWLMYGIQNFPTPTNEVHLDYLKTLSRLFDLPVGYQDHSDADTEAAFWLPAYAMGLGILIQEKHITHNRAHKGFDHEAALNPDEFIDFTDMIKILNDAKGSSIPKPFSEQEHRYRKYSKKSLVAARTLEEERVINKEDLMIMRAVDLGLPPDQSKRLIGKKLKNKIEQYQLIKEDDVF